MYRLEPFRKTLYPWNKGKKTCVSIIWSRVVRAERVFLAYYNDIKRILFGSSRFLIDKGGESTIRFKLFWRGLDCLESSYSLFLQAALVKYFNIKLLKSTLGNKLFFILLSIIKYIILTHTILFSALNKRFLYSLKE